MKKYVEMLEQAGFQTAVSHSFRPLRLKEGVTLREMLMGGPRIFPKRLKTVEHSSGSEEALPSSVK